MLQLHPQNSLVSDFCAARVNPVPERTGRFAAETKAATTDGREALKQMHR